MTANAMAGDLESVFKKEKTDGLADLLDEIDSQLGRVMQSIDKSQAAQKMTNICFFRC